MGSLAASVLDQAIGSYTKMVKLVLLLVLSFELSTAHNCPPIIDWPGEYAPIPTKTYRYVTEVDYSRCVGKIAKCIYTVHLKYYCFSGKRPNLTPHEMYPTSEPVMQNVFTGPFGTSGLLNMSPFDFEAAIGPFLSLKMCPGNFVHRLVNQGLEMVKLEGVSDTETVSAGDCPTNLTYNQPKEFHLHLGDYVTEALVRTGYVLDRLTLVVTRNDGNHEGFSVGGPYGAPADATPLASKYGPCQMVNINGTVLDNVGPEFEGHFISAIGFLWSCFGVPESFF